MTNISRKSVTNHFEQQLMSDTKDETLIEYMALANGYCNIHTTWNGMRKSIPPFYGYLPILGVASLS
jgi:desulfoferrodoxin (superoxide reductase-like protein)